MTDLEIALVCFLNEHHRNNIYRYEKYQMLHNVKYRKEMPVKYLQMVRNQYRKNGFEAAYELKTYYMENGFLSNTIVLKMRPESPKIQEFRSIKIHSGLNGKDLEYTHHAIEVFKEDGKYKVLDILHRDHTVWLESYLDNVCSTNRSPRKQLRYDLGYLAPCHALAGNMQELSDLMRYLDKKYGIGKPRLSLINISGGNHEGCLLSDDMAMDFDDFGRMFGATGEEVVMAYKRIYDTMMTARFNVLHLLCLGHILRDPIISAAMAEALFDDTKMCQLMEDYQIMSENRKTAMEKVSGIPDDK